MTTPREDQTKKSRTIVLDLTMCTMEYQSTLDPPPSLALIKFPDRFDTDMAFQLRERNQPTLDDMQSVAVSVEANLLAKRARVRNERRAPLKDEATPFDLKMDALAKGMEKLMDRMENIERKPH